MVRPERFELPTFWFVARRRKTYLVDLKSLRTSQGAFSCPRSCPQTDQEPAPTDSAPEFSRNIRTPQGTAVSL